MMHLHFVYLQIQAYLLKKFFGVWIQALNLKASSMWFFIQLDILMVYWHVRCVWIQALKNEFWN